MKRFEASALRMAAAITALLLPFALFGAPLQAQTIRNIAEANWTYAGNRQATASNEVTIALAQLPPEIVTFRPDNAGAAIEYRTPLCAIGASSSAFLSSASAVSDDNLTSLVTKTDMVHAGQDFYFRIRADSANSDPAVIDTLRVVVDSGVDREEMTIYETAPDSGIFVGRLRTARVPPAAVHNDCRLGVTDSSRIHIAVHRPVGDEIVVEGDLGVLADPFGVLFDSETGEPVSDARVTLVDAATGQPATVFAEDGTTPWPSTVVSGQPITDGAGNTYAMAPGEYWFPRTALGNYRLVVQPPSPFTAPSVVGPEQLARLTRPDGGSFAISDASYGASFALVDATPLQVDLPLDRPGVAITLTKSVSRANALPGDTVFYTLSVHNPDPARAKRDVVLTDIPSRWLWVRTNSIRIDGLENQNATAIAPDGSRLMFDLGDIPGGQTRRVTYAMTVRADAPPGDAVNEAATVDVLGRVSRANAVVNIERDTIAGRMTIVGRVTAGTCSEAENRIGIPGVRVMMEDGSFAITDADGRYHLDGVVPGTHVVQASPATLPEGSEFVDCHRSTRSAGSATSLFVTGQGGSLAVADFHATMSEALVTSVYAAHAGKLAETGGAATIDTAGNDGSDVDWIALGDGANGWLFPAEGHNPRSPAIRVALRHRAGQQVRLTVDGSPVDPLAFEGTRQAADGSYAVSLWRGVPLRNEATRLRAEILAADGSVAEIYDRQVHFTTTPTKVELVSELSNLVADGRTRPVVAVRVLDRNNRPLREGVYGELKLNAPYQSAEQIERQQLDQLTGLDASSARWVVEGSDGIALIELAPTMVSGSLRLDFRFDDGEVVHERKLETWITPGDIEWTVVGLAEGSVGARTVADNMERAGRFDSDLGDEARIALYAKGRVLGKYLLTLAYDSAKQREDQRVLGALDPTAYYTVYADGSSRRFDAASREKLYVRIESASFYALYGDFETGFDQTRLTRYHRVATGVKGEARLGAFRAQGFAAEISTRFRRDEIQGQGITGPYRLGSRSIVPNSEKVFLETRDRFRSELIVSREELVRFLDYDIDLLSGTITFKQPVLSRDFDFNPQFVVVEYEIGELSSGGELNAGVRADWTNRSDTVRIGASAITDKGDGARTDIAGVDMRARIGTATEIRAELAVSNSEGNSAKGWLVEAQHQTGSLDLLAYARSLDADYGVGQQNGAELGRRKFGLDGRYGIDEHFSVAASAWQDESLTDISRRRAMQVQFGYNSNRTDARIGLSRFDDRLADGSRNRSTVLEAGATQRLFDNRLELSAGTSLALDDASSIDLPERHEFGVRYAITQAIRLIGRYEIAKGENIDARNLSGGFELSPWQGARMTSSLGKQRIAEAGERSYAAFGLAQTLQVTDTLTIDATIDGNRTLGGSPSPADIVNPRHPVASGGQFGPAATLFEDFTAVTLGAAWRKDRWSATARGEYRNGEYANRKGFTLGAIRQLGEGSIVGSGLTWTQAEGESIQGGEVGSEIFDAAIAFAHRPADSEIAMLGKLEYRSDSVTGAVAGETGPAGRTALLVSGDAKSRRAIASLSTNWSPQGSDEQGGLTRRDEFGLFLAARYNFDRFEGFDLAGTTLLAGLDARIGMGERIEIGATANVRTSIDDDLTSFSIGPQVGFTPAKGILLTVGYNVSGFRDEDFSAARNTDRGFYASVRLKLDADSFSFLGLGR